MKGERDGMMQDNDARNIFYLLDIARLVELAMEDFYKACATCYPNSADFWLGIAGEESMHAQYIREIETLVRENPQGFNLKQKVTLDILRCFIRDVESETQSVLDGTRDVLSLPSLAEKFEALMVESSFFDMLESDNQDYEKLVKRIQAETVEHRLRIRGRDWTCDL